MILISESEIELTAIRAQGAGGQNVNKVSSAIHLRFDVNTSSLPDDVKARLMVLAGNRLTKSGEIVIKARVHRTQELNKMDALFRLHQLVASAEVAPALRKKTKPSKSSIRARLQNKAMASEKKSQRMRVSFSRDNQLE